MVSPASRTLSKSIFGNAYWLAVAALIAEIEDSTFTQRLLARRLGISDSLVAPALKRLEAADLIKRKPDHWERQPSPVWRFVALLARDVD
ncbi:MAG TPA: helix-turn-helix domain-containing protein [Iamia sp.]